MARRGGRVASGTLSVSWLTISSFHASRKPRPWSAGRQRLEQGGLALAGGEEGGVPAGSLLRRGRFGSLRG